MIVLGHFDIAYATNTLAWFAMNPREGHLIAAKWIFGYFVNYPKGELLLDPEIPDYSDLHSKFQE